MKGLLLYLIFLCLYGPNVHRIHLIFLVYWFHIEISNWCYIFGGEAEQIIGNRSFLIML